MKKIKYGPTFSCLAFFGIYFLIVTSVTASVKPIRFEHFYDIPELSKLSATAIVQDDNGFIWIASETGLYRFDGYELKQYIHNNNLSNSLSENYVFCLFKDSLGTLWVGTSGGGLNRYDFDQDRFVHYQSSPDDPTTLSDNHINAITEDPFGYIWVGTADGLNKLNKVTGKVKRFYQGKEKGGLSDNTVNTLVSDSNDNIWVGTKKGLDKINSQLDTVQATYQFENEFSKEKYNPVLSIYTEHSNDILVGTNEGIYRMKERGNEYQVTNLIESNQDKFLNYSINSITMDERGNIWLGSRKSGIIKVQPGSKEYVQYTHQLGNTGGLNSDYVNKLYFDGHNNLWVATAEGVSKLSSVSQNIDYFPHTGQEGEVIFDKDILALFVDSKNNLWVGTFHGGLYQYNQNHELIRQYAHNPNDQNSISRGAISSIVEDDSGLLWVATIGGGLNRLDPKTHTATHFLHNENDDNSISNDSVHALHRDGKDSLWIGTFKGVDHFNFMTGEFTHYLYSDQERAGLQESTGLQENTGLSDNNVLALLVDSRNRLWVGTQKGGLNLFDQASKSFTHFKHDPDDVNTIGSNFVSSISESESGLIWIGTVSGGLNSLDVENNLVSRYEAQDGLISNNVMAVLNDDHHNVWVSSDSGLSRFNTNLKRWTNFTAEDGLQENDFYLRSAFRSKSGELFFGGINGYNRINPANIGQPDKPSTVVLTDFLLFNNTVLVDSKQNDSKNKFKLKQNISNTKKLVLTHKDNLFSFEFSALNSRNPKLVQYSYQLEGWDEQWLQTNYKKRYATYSNIPAGDYYLNVKAKQGHHDWGKTTTIAIKILPPVWRTYWAYSIYIILTIGLVSAFLWLYAKKRNAEFLRQKVQSEHSAALKIAETKDQLLANISHEFRTPLTLILGPLDSLAEKSEREQDKSEILRIKRNSQRLLAMVDQLLDLARLKRNASTEWRYIDVWQSSHFIVESFRGIAQSRNIKLNLNPDVRVDLGVNMTPDSFEKILTNLLSNAFKYSPDESCINVEISCVDLKKVKIDVIDDGYGIAKEDQARIFERFVQVNKYDSNGVGVGIGLALVKELVSSHLGSIFVNSELMKGSCFSVVLPLAKAPDNKIGEALQSEAKPSANYLISELSKLKSESPVEVNTDTEQDAQKMSILIVEDNQEMHRYLLDCFSENYHCICASDGQQGVNKAIEHMPDLIISDLMMPVKDGYQLTEELRNNEKTSHIPIMLLTAKGDLKSRIKGWQATIDDYVVKPFNPVELNTRIKALLANRKKLRSLYGSVLGFHSPLELSEASKMSPADSAFVKKFEQCITEHYQNPELNRGVIASKLFMTERQLNRKLSALVEHNFSSYLRKFRLRKALALIRQGRSISEISESVGFGSVAYFSRCFKKEYGRPPSEYGQVNDKILLE
ncbi:hybrid sensor histidine kinase/response regulator transcription factor [Aliikangiella coralliicola]|uniref:histidine kinase n=1 Tax=Aliikangiella coralliicola TaxID=2592383 RepID=A0A545UJA8_9GAMM|nr:two-component regulator propeller domain-containing protein [Aliikangiella coralliicola]TQV89554.1 response regulator [Aliikangiella coralliicola]